MIQHRWPKSAITYALAESTSPLSGVRPPVTVSVITLTARSAETGNQRSAGSTVRSMLKIEGE